jgi:lipopolysaccharide transport system ATP-binding protein
MSSLSISVENVSKVYRLGEINRGQFFGDVRRWVRGKFNPSHTFGDPETEAEQEPKAADLFYALRNVSFDIKQGETVGIIGANGAGKSTLLKLITRITAPSTGSIRINGRIGSLLEVGTGFHPDLTGRDNVYMNGAILGMTRREIAAKFDQIVSFSGVEDFIDTPVKRYSSGMYVKLAFSVAAFLEPEILIVDEVLSVGDQEFKDRCMERMKEIIRDGRTILFVSHEGDLVRSLCSRAICMRKGQIVCDDTASEALDYYHARSKEECAIVG